MKESKDLLNEVKKIVTDIVHRSTKAHAINEAYLRNTLRDEVGIYLYKKTQRQPMVLPVIMEV